MKKLLLIALPLAISSVILLQGCLKDSTRKSYTYTYYKPVYRTSEEVRANIKSNAPKQIERPGKIYVRGQYIFLNEVDKGIHVIDNSNPAQPQNIAFIDIPGNMDLAVKGNTLYADLYTDLVAIDISNPRNIVLKKIVAGVFPERVYNAYFIADSSKVIVSWERRDTTVAEGNYMTPWFQNSGIFMSYTPVAGAGSVASVSPYGVGGSTARFTIVDERLYTVATSGLNVFNIADPYNPFTTATRNIGWDIETIFPFRDKLFIGSQSGMFIYNIANPDNPFEEGKFGHVRSCDPVIADNEYAYVTLRSGSICAGFTNELEVLDLSLLSNPALVKIYPMDNPRGLSKDGNTLFICDGLYGVKIYNATDVSNMQLLKTIGGMESNDIITMNGNAIVVAEDGLYQYDYSDLNNIRLLSKMNVSN